MGNFYLLHRTLGFILFFWLFISCDSQKVKSDEKSIELRDSTFVDSVVAAEIIEDSIPVFSIKKEVLMGKVDYRKDKRFTRLKRYTNKEIYLLREVDSAFTRMADCATEDGICLKVISGGRNYEYQKGIWDTKWANFSGEDSVKARKILLYSSMPGTSRHHWGTDLDLNNLENDYFENGRGKIEYEWLVLNADFYGFFQPYSNKDETCRTGYEEEKWHWSYYPIADLYLEEYNRQVLFEDLAGFEGHTTVANFGVIENYVNGINKNKN